MNDDVKKEAGASSKRVQGTPASFDPAEVRSWIIEICDAFDITPTLLAKKARMAPSTINKFLNGTSINKNLSGSSLMSIGVAIADMAQGREDIIVEVSPSTLTAADRALLVASSMTTKVNVIGIVGHGLRQHKIDFEEGELKYAVSIPRSYSDRKHMVGFELREEDNKYYPNGTILICAELDTEHTEYVAGQKVLVIARFEDGFEGSVFEYQVDPRDNGWLMPTADEAQSRQVAFLGKEKRLVRQGYICAVVVASVRKE